MKRPSRSPVTAGTYAHFQEMDDLRGLDRVGLGEGRFLDRASIVAAAEGAEAIVHAVNPPGYRNWAKLVLPMIENTIAAAKSSGARILLPGTIYNYGEDAFPILREDSPQNAATHKGKIRIALEKKLEDAARNGVRSLIVRFGDFFGPKPGNSWFSQGMVKPHSPLNSITYPGRKGVGHDWAYLPDAGEAFAQLMDRQQDLPDFCQISLPRRLGRGRSRDNRRDPPGRRQALFARSSIALVHLQVRVALP